MRYYKRIDKDGLTMAMESYSHDNPVRGAIEIPKKEFDEFLASLPIPIIKPPRDLISEIDALNERIAKLEG